MRILLAAGLFILPVAAKAEPQQESRSATAACLSAVIDGAPVGDVDGDDVTIRRGVDPVSCTVRVTSGEPVVIRETVLATVRKRAELFAPAKTAWAPGEFASQETFCSLSLRRSLNVTVNTAKPGRQPVLLVTVFELPKRDERCDRNIGLQAVDEVEPAPEIPAAAPTPQAAESPAKAKRWRLPRLPGFLSSKE